MGTTANARLADVSSFMGSGPTIFYAVHSTVEIACTGFIVWYAWRRHTSQNS
jgi:hypothetical protein